MEQLGTQHLDDQHGQATSPDPLPQFSSLIWSNIVPRLTPRQMQSLRQASSEMLAMIDSTRPSGGLALDFISPAPLATLCGADENFLKVHQRGSKGSGVHPWLTHLSIKGIQCPNFNTFVHFIPPSLPNLRRLSLVAEEFFVDSALAVLSRDHSSSFHELAITILPEINYNQTSAEGVSPYRLSDLLFGYSPTLYSALQRLELPTGVHVNGRQMAKQLPQLQHFEWTCWKLPEAPTYDNMHEGPATLKHLSALSQLTSLRLHHFPACADEIDYDGDVADFHDLSQQAQQLLRELPALNKLRQLSLTPARCIGGRDLSIVSHLTTLTQLEVVWVMEIPEDPGRLLRAVQVLPNLRELKVPEMQLGASCLHALAILARLTLLSCHSISSTPGALALQPHISDEDSDEWEDEGASPPAPAITAVATTQQPPSQLASLLDLTLEQFTPAVDLPGLFPQLTRFDCTIRRFRDASGFEALCRYEGEEATAVSAARALQTSNGLNSTWLQLREVRLSSVHMRTSSCFKAFAHCRSVTVQESHHIPWNSVAEHCLTIEEKETQAIQRLHTIAAPMSAVAELRLIEWTNPRVEDYLFSLLSVWQQLVQIELIGLYALTDTGMAALLPLHELRKVHVEACPLVTTQSITALTACASLEDVVVLACLWVAPAECYGLVNARWGWRLNVVVEDKRVTHVAPAPVPMHDESAYL